MGDQCAYDAGITKEIYLISRELPVVSDELMADSSQLKAFTMFLSVPDFIGRFHPVLVHLPIGILLLACFFQLLTIRTKFIFLQPAIPLMIFWGMVGAVVSCISGYLLSLSGDYDAALVARHQWAGIITALLSLWLYILYRVSISVHTARWISAIVIIAITITGHWGGTLTHGSGYLTQGLQGGVQQSGGIKPVPDIQEAIAYTDLVQPLLQAKCYTCHGASKQKGKLRLDQPPFILKGGEEGKVVEPGKADESEMIERMLLPIEDEDHMPPKEKPQLTKNEIALLQWWINSGADFSKKVKELPQPEPVKPVLLSFQAGSQPVGQQLGDVPETPVEAGDAATIARLKQSGVTVLPVAKNSNYLSVSFFTAEAGADTLVKLLVPLQEQIVWLKLDNARVADSSMKHIGALSKLTRLQLSNTNITDAGLTQLRSLQQLQTLNLVGTKVTAQGLSQLNGLSKLRFLYLYRTTIGLADWPLLQKTFPSAKIDTGKYTVPTLAQDTVEIKY